MKAVSSVRVSSQRTPKGLTAGDDGLYRLLVEHGPEATLLVDLESELCIYASPAVERLLGRDPRELVDRRLTEFVHPDDVREVVARSVARRRGRGVPTVVSRMLHANGRWIWVQATGSEALPFSGREVAVFSVSAAAERVHAELGLQAARTRLRRRLARPSEGRDLQQTRTGAYDLTVEALAAALELRDDESCRHARRVTELALELTRALDSELAADPELPYAYLLHDVGKIGIPDAILLKPGRLTERERSTMQMHTTLGERLISQVPFLSDVVHDVVAFHHERWDGTGYPCGLSGEEIPLAARIFAVVDAFDAITNDRPYRKARAVEDALAELERSAGTHFDPAIVEVFVRILRAPAIGSP
ncbi:MAG TPA: HD domain-containing phosphohydrolase [Gaiellaceae bacterium]|nr:HD domain-containing phosphohydrolase [Gaiellaceae bacterium]